MGVMIFFLMGIDWLNIWLSSNLIVKLLYRWRVTEITSLDYVPSMCADQSLRRILKGAFYDFENKYISYIFDH